MKESFEAELSSRKIEAVNTLSGYHKSQHKVLNLYIQTCHYDVQEKTIDLLSSTIIAN